MAGQHKLLGALARGRRPGINSVKGIDGALNPNPEHLKFQVINCGCRTIAVLEDGRAINQSK